MAKEIPESSRLQILEKFQAILFFAEKDADDNTSGPFNRGIVDLTLFKTNTPKVTQGKFLEVMDAFASLA